MEKRLKVLLTGASGTVGTEVLKLLDSKPGIDLYTFDIQTDMSRKIIEPFPLNHTFIIGDITNPADLKQIPENMEVVIHLAALIPPAADRNPALTRKVNVDGTKNLIDYLKMTSPDAFIMYSSSVSVYGDRILNPAIYTTDEIHPSEGDVYGQTKVEAEEIIRNSGLNHTIFRLAAIMKNHRISPLMFHMPLNTQIEICSPEDTAQAFAEAVNHREELQGRTFNLGGGEKCRLTYRSLLIRSFQLFGLGKLNFPAYAFARRNFHCGIMADGDELERILHFRKDTTESYFDKTRQGISPVIKLLAVIFRPWIKLYLLLGSEPFWASVRRDKKAMQHFFP